VAVVGADCRALGGFYSYDLIENLVGGEIATQNRLASR
jgi:hypothetical protein